MTILFIVLIIIASAVLGLIVLVQNPKGGGLAGNIAGFSNQFMGVKQTTDVLEKGTWIFAGLVGLLCILSVLFISGGSSSSSAATEAATPATRTTTTPAGPVNNVPPANTPGTQTSPQK